jgi:hypothetical protein
MAGYDQARSRRKYGSPRLVNRKRVARDAMRKCVLAENMAFGVDLQHAFVVKQYRPTQRCRNRHPESERLVSSKCEAFATDIQYRARAQYARVLTDAGEFERQIELKTHLGSLFPQETPPG